MTAVVEWTAPCPTCGQPATWRSADPGDRSKPLAPLGVHCEACKRGISVWTEPPSTAPRVSTALACIARRMMFGSE